MYIDPTSVEEEGSGSSGVGVGVGVGVASGVLCDVTSTVGVTDAGSVVSLPVVLHATSNGRTITISINMLRIFLLIITDLSFLVDPTDKTHESVLLCN